MRLRPVIDDDLPALLAVQHTVDTAWFGAPEHDEGELREWFDHAAGTVVALDGERIAGFALTIRAGDPASRSVGGQLVVPPGADHVTATLLDWVEAEPTTEIEAFERDEALRAALDARGWRHTYSSYDLFMPADSPLDAPQLPDGVEFRPLTEDRYPDVHRLVYVDAGWSDIQGHHERTEEQWRSIFLDGRSADETPVVAWRDDRPVAVALVRAFSDGTGWISQLAVSRDERRNGLGGAVLREAFGRLGRLDAVTTLGLAVIADNRKALNLYLKVGLEVRREWLSYRRPAS